MILSPTGLLFIKHWEGFRAQMYTDVAGHATIGYGHLIRPDDMSRWLGLTLDRAAAELLLEIDLSRSQTALHKLCTVELTQGQYDALVSFVFNLGQGALGRSTLLKKLNAMDYEGAAKEFPRWCFAGGKRIPGLLARREAEKAMFSSPEGADVFV